MVIRKERKAMKKETDLDIHSTLERMAMFLNPNNYDDLCTMCANVATMIYMTDSGAVNRFNELCKAKDEKALRHSYRISEIITYEIQAYPKHLLRGILEDKDVCYEFIGLLKKNEELDKIMKTHLLPDQYENYRKWCEE